MFADENGHNSPGSLLVAACIAGRRFFLLIFGYSIYLAPFRKIYCSGWARFHKVLISYTADLSRCPCCLFSDTCRCHKDAHSGGCPCRSNNVLRRFWCDKKDPSWRGLCCILERWTRTYTSVCTTVWCYSIHVWGTSACIFYWLRRKTTCWFRSQGSAATFWNVISKSRPPRWL